MSSPRRTGRARTPCSTPVSISPEIVPTLANTAVKPDDQARRREAEVQHLGSDASASELRDRGTTRAAGSHSKRCRAPGVVQAEPVEHEEAHAHHERGDEDLAPPRLSEGEAGHDADASQGVARVRARPAETHRVSHDAPPRRPRGRAPRACGAWRTTPMMLRARTGEPCDERRNRVFGGKADHDADRRLLAHDAADLGEGRRARPRTSGSGEDRSRPRTARRAGRRVARTRQGGRGR